MSRRATWSLPFGAHWVRAGGLTVLDQGVSAGANFVMQILLARSLAPESYGAFTVAFSIYLFAFALYNTLILEPMSVLGPARHAHELRAYTLRQFWNQWIVAGVLCAALLAAWMIADGRGGETLAALGGFAAAAPFLFLFQFVRRACYLETDPASALRGSVAYAVVLLVGLAWTGNGLTAGRGIALLAAACTAGSLVMARASGLAGRGVPSGWTRRTGARMFAESWGYGRWITANSLVSWAAGAAYVPLTGAVAGLGAAGTFKALDNLLAPVGQTLTALGGLVLPRMARGAGEGGWAWVRPRALRFGWLAAAGVMAYVLVMWAVAGPVAGRVYGAQSPYVAAAALLPWLGGAYVIRALADSGLGIGLRAAGHSRPMFLSAVAGAAVTLTAGVALVHADGLRGALVGQLLSGGAQLAMLVWVFVRVPARGGASPAWGVGHA